MLCARSSVTAIIASSQMASKTYALSGEVRWPLMNGQSKLFGAFAVVAAGTQGVWVVPSSAMSAEAKGTSPVRHFGSARRLCWGGCRFRVGRHILGACRLTFQVSRASECPCCMPVDIIPRTLRTDVSIPCLLARPSPFVHGGFSTQPVCSQSCGSRLCKAFPK